MLPHIQVERLDQLPNLDAAKTLFLDFETDSGVPTKAEADPWHGAKIAMIGISDGKMVWTIATERMKRGQHRLPLEPVLAWLKYTLACKRERVVAHWIRAEAALSRAEGCPINRAVEWYCTEIASHHYYDNQYQHNLRVASDAITGFGEVGLQEDLILDWLCDAKLGSKSKPGNFAEIPVDILSRYLYTDVMATLLLYEKFTSSFEEAQYEALRNDFECNKILHDMQYAGVRIDKPRLLLALMYLKMDLIQLGSSISGELGREFNPMSQKQMEGLFCGEWGLPVLRWTEDTEKANPSFDDDTLKLYLKLEPIQKSPSLRGVIQAIDMYREQKKILGYVEQYFELEVDGRLHGKVHPCAAHGGRTTCARPNLQNLPPFMKMFVLPEEGHGFFNIDASQVEYRWMAHYMQDPKLIRGYSSGDRNFDIHKFVQDWLKIKRRDAKILNFGTAFCMGKKKLTRELSAMSGGQVTLEQGGAILDRYYNELVPTLRGTQRAIEGVAKSRGWVKNFFGRRSHLDTRSSYRGFNRVVQGSAADMVKERMVAVDRALRAEGLEVVCLPKLMVHDELVFSIECRPEIRNRAIGVIVRTLEAFDRARVPMWWEGAWATGNWLTVAEIKDDKNVPPTMLGGVPVKLIP